MKFNKFYTFAGIGFIMLASLIMRANASNNGKKGSLVDAYWSTVCTNESGHSNNLHL